MSVQQTEQPAAPQHAERRSVSIRTVLLLVLVVILTLLAVKNWQPVDVWPLGPGKPLTLVIGISFVLGALIGWLVHSLAFGRPPRRTL